MTASLIYLLVGLAVFLLGRARFRFPWSWRVFALVVLFWPIYLWELLP